MRASLQLTYSVLEPFRYAGRNYEPGMQFNARRLDPRRRQLQRWVDEGKLAHPRAPKIEEEPEVEEEEDGDSPF